MTSEGSSLSLKETANLLERWITSDSKMTWVLKEAESHKENYDEILMYSNDLSLDTLLCFHRKLLSMTKREIGCKIRDHQVPISGSKFVPPMPVEVYPLLKEFFRWYSRNKDMVQPVELVGIVQLRILAIHPFIDGNGRIAHLMMNLVLDLNDHPMLDIPYEKKGGYYRAL